eukprot:scaffold78895_cov22-Tisochrysis_lutea.AAC.1
MLSPCCVCYDPAAQVLDRFHNWIQSGGAGPSWSVDPINHEGWRINVAEDEGRRGWLLLRQSLHDPLLVSVAGLPLCANALDWMRVRQESAVNLVHTSTMRQAVLTISALSGRTYCRFAPWSVRKMHGKY